MIFADLGNFGVADNADRIAKLTFEHRKYLQNGTLKILQSSHRTCRS